MATAAIRPAAAPMRLSRSIQHVGDVAPSRAQIVDQGVEFVTVPIAPRTRVEAGGGTQERLHA